MEGGGLCWAASCIVVASCGLNESSVKVVPGLGDELLRKADELASAADTLGPFAGPVLEGGFADGRLVGAGAFRRLSLAVLALLFGGDLGASLSSRADLRISSA